MHIKVMKENIFDSSAIQKVQNKIASNTELLPLGNNEEFQGMAVLDSPIPKITGFIISCITKKFQITKKKFSITAQNGIECKTYIYTNKNSRYYDSLRWT